MREALFAGLYMTGLTIAWGCMIVGLCLMAMLAFRCAKSHNSGSFAASHTFAFGAALYMLLINMMPK